MSRTGHRVPPAEFVRARVGHIEGHKGAHKGETGDIMTKAGEHEGAQALIAQGADPPLPRLDGESEPAYAARRAYCQLPAAERSVAATYRVIKGEPPDSTLRAPGHFHRWAKKFDWPGSASRWDTYMVALPAEPADTVEELAAIRQTAIEQTRALQEMIDHTLTELQAPARPLGLLGWLSRLLPGRRKSKLVELQILTAAYGNLRQPAALSNSPPQLPPPDRE